MIGNDLGASSGSVFRWRTEFSVFFVALVARLLFLFVNGASVYPDSGVYATLARNISELGVFSLEREEPHTPTIRRPPIYPAFLAVLAWVGVSSAEGVAVVQIVLDSITAVLVLRLARMVVSPNWAVAVAVFYALFPGAIYASCSILSETLFTILLLSAVLLILVGVRENRAALTFAGGAVLGGAVLCRSLALLYPFLLALAMVRLRKTTIRPLLQVALLLAGALATIAPWVGRCYLVSGRLVFVQGGVGAVMCYWPTLSHINQSDEAALCDYFEHEDPYGRRLREARTPAEVVDADQFGIRQTVSNIRADPSAYLASRLRSYPHLFLTSFDRFTQINMSFGQLLATRDIARLVLKASFLVVFSLAPFLLGLAGLWSARKNAAASYVAVIWLAVLVSYLPMWVEYRYWLPAVPFLLVSAGNSLEALTGWVSEALAP